VADPQPEDEAAAGGIRDQGGALGAGVRVTQIDIGDPGPHLDALRRLPHQESGGHDVVVDFGGEDRFEPGRFGLPGDRPGFVGTPARTGDHGKCKSLCHRAILSSVPIGQCVPSYTTGDGGGSLWQPGHRLDPNHHPTADNAPSPQ
jgi:hypothetical protein